MKHSESIAAIAEALAAAQLEYIPVAKNKTAKVKMKSGGEYGYSYADLADILSMAIPRLSKQGIAFSQPHTIVNGKLRVVTFLMHKSGEWMESDGIEISEDGDPQQFGAESTYFRRYDGASFIGVAPDEDTDAQQAGKRTPKPVSAISHPDPKPQGAPAASQGTQGVTGRAASSPAQAQPQPGHTKRTGTDGLIATIKSLENVPGKAKTATTKAVNPWLRVNLLSPYNGASWASCFDDKFWPCLREGIGLQCEFQIVEKENKGNTFLNILDVRWIAGEEYVNGVAVKPEGASQ